MNILMIASYLDFKYFGDTDSNALVLNNWLNLEQALN